MCIDKRKDRLKKYNLERKEKNCNKIKRLIFSYLSFNYFYSKTPNKPRISKIAKDTNLSRQTVSKCLKELGFFKHVKSQIDKQFSSNN